MKTLEDIVKELINAGHKIDHIPKYEHFDEPVYKLDGKYIIRRGFTPSGHQDSIHLSVYTVLGKSVGDIDLLRIDPAQETLRQISIFEARIKQRKEEARKRKESFLNKVGQEIKALGYNVKMDSQWTLCICDAKLRVPIRVIQNPKDPQRITVSIDVGRRNYTAYIVDISDPTMDIISCLKEAMTLLNVNSDYHRLRKIFKQKD